MKPVTLYAIHTPVGRMARWLPSIDEAKRVYAASVAERDYEDDERRPEVSFEASSVDDQGDQCAEHVNCLLDGNLDCCIWSEPAQWPEYNIGYGAAPALVMQGDPVADCRHPQLSCSGATEPAIRCTACGTTWAPAGFAP